jgi:hypothetical protein
MARAGFVGVKRAWPSTWSADPAQAAIERGLLDQSYTSQLTILSKQEYQPDSIVSGVH